VYPAIFAIWKQRELSTERMAVADPVQRG
jgi:hypothetical protein